MKLVRRTKDEDGVPDPKGKKRRFRADIPGGINLFSGGRSCQKTVSERADRHVSGQLSGGRADGRIIGFINGAVTDSPVIRDEMFEDSSLHQEDGKLSEILGLDVHPDYRERDRTDLMQHLMGQAKKQNKAGLILTCKETLISFYEQFGYQSMGISESVHGGAVWYDMILEINKKKREVI